MDVEDIRQVAPFPELREPVIVAGFAGWNDAGQAATHALETLTVSWSAPRFAEIDAELFFDFTETRPIISLGPEGQRSLEWPTNAFFAHQVPECDRDIVILLGTEPQLRWRHFCSLVLKVADQLQASCLVTLGGLLADVPHTMEPRLTGFATSPRLLPQLQKLGVRMSTYEGPTGIVGALHDSWRSGGKPALSLWANVPHYISASPNPHVALALLKRVSSVLAVPLPTSGLEAQATAFQEQIDEALENNPEALEYVRQLESQYANETPSADAPQLIEALEEFLRTRRPQDDSGPD